MQSPNGPGPRPASSASFGTNIVNIMLILLADLIFRGGPVLGSAGQFEVIGATLAVPMIGVYMVGLLERENKAVLRMGSGSLDALLA